MSSRYSNPSLGALAAVALASATAPAHAATYTFLDIIDPLNRPFTQALSLNNLGEIVGDYVDSGRIMHGFLDNSGALTTLDPTGSTVTTINGINDLVRSSASM